MYYHHQQNNNPLGGKHLDGPSALSNGLGGLGNDLPGRLNGGGGGGGSGGNSSGGGAGGGGGWGRHPSFPQNGLPMGVSNPSFPPNGMLGFQSHSSHAHSNHGGHGAHGHGHGHGHHANHHPGPQHGHLHHQSVGVGIGAQHHGHPHHPSFGSGSAMHLGGGMGMPPNQGYGMGAYGVIGGQASPPREQREVVLTHHWQTQLQRADASRNASSPHHRARTAAMTSRMSNKPSSVVTISNPADRPGSAAAAHRKGAASITVGLAPDRALTPEPSEASTTPLMGNNLPGTANTTNADPGNPAVQPAPTESKDEGPPEPWTGLDLGGIRLKNLSPAMFAFSHITSLFINHNNLSTLPPEIGQLRNLTTLDATANELTALPAEIGLLNKLEELLLFDNHISSLPQEIGSLYKLTFLGIEGNPIEERTRKLLADEGTEAVIAHFRDNATHTSAPPERQWITVEPDVSAPSAGKQESFTVLTYNILCPSFAPPSAYKYTPSWALDWQYRKQTILQEIVNASADVVCLQEVDVETFTEWLYPQLSEHGYSGAHYPRSRAKTMSPEERKLVDGCCTFWKDDRLRLVETDVVEFNQIAMSKLEIRTEDMFNRVMSRDNIGVVAKLEFRASGAKILVANSHIYWDHRYRDVKLVQIGMLMEQLEKAAKGFAKYPAHLEFDAEYNNGKPSSYDAKQEGRDVPFVLCVDLNSLSGSAVYDYLSTGEIAPDHEDFMDHAYGVYTQEGLKHELGLKSACSSFGEMKMTNFTPTFEATIDYIFYSPKSLKVTSVLGDVDRDYLDKVVGFPNAHFPSDHIPVFAQFRIKGNEEN